MSGFSDYLVPGLNWVTALKSLDDDEFCLDPTRMTLVCGTAGYDGTQFKGILANKYNLSQLGSPPVHQSRTPAATSPIWCECWPKSRVKSTAA